MSARELADLISINLPEWRSVDVQDGLVFVRPEDWAASGGNVDHASFTFWLCTINEDVATLMRRRVPQGFAEVNASVVAGAPATRYEYTDGVRCIHSYFVARAVVIEIMLATYLHATGDQKVDLESIAPTLFAHVAWLPRP